MNKTHDLEKKIYDFMSNSKATKLNLSEIAKGVAVKDSEYKILKRAMHFLSQSNKVKRVNGSNYVVIKQKESLKANKKHTNKFSKVARFSSEKLTHVVAVYMQKEKSFRFVHPELKRTTLKAKVDDIEKYTLTEGNVVMVKLIKNGDKVVGATVSEYKFDSISGNESLFSLLASGIPEKFSSKALAEADEISETISNSEIKRRTDLRKLPFVTIDGEDARDFDDAVYAKILDGGLIEVTVAIADVSYYIRPKTQLDREALILGNSTYYPQFVRPMLPEAISNGICSLVPNEDRLVMAVTVVINEETGEMQSYKFFNAVIHSHMRLTYNQVQQAIEGDYTGVVTKNFYDETITPLERAYHARKKQKLERGGLKIEKDETLILMDKQGSIEGVSVRDHFDAHMLIEELMILANVAASSSLANNVCIYRVHEQPSEEKIMDLIYTLAGLGITLDDDVDLLALEPADVQRIIEKVVEHDGNNNNLILVLRAMKKACYSNSNSGHFGLALKGYSHFTSPIRRYPDLALHRQIKKLILDSSPGGFEYDSESMGYVADKTSLTERTSAASEKQAYKRILARHYTPNVGENFDVEVALVSNDGVYVRIPDTGAEGVLSSKDLKDLGYNLDEKTKSLISFKRLKPINVSSKLTVKLVKTDVVLGTMIFEYVSFTAENFDDQAA